MISTKWSRAFCRSMAGRESRRGTLRCRAWRSLFGESSQKSDASKVGLCHLVARLRLGGFLLDTQFITNHLARFGAHEIPKKDYQERLAGALYVRATFPASAPDWMVKNYYTE